MGIVVIDGLGQEWPHLNLLTVYSELRSCWRKASWRSYDAVCYVLRLLLPAAAMDRRSSDFIASLGSFRCWSVPVRFIAPASGTSRATSPVHDFRPRIVEDAPTIKGKPGYQDIPLGDKCLCPSAPISPSPSASVSINTIGWRCACRSMASVFGSAPTPSCSVPIRKRCRPLATFGPLGPSLKLWQRKDIIAAVLALIRPARRDRRVHVRHS